VVPIEEDNQPSQRSNLHLSEEKLSEKESEDGIIGALKNSLQKNYDKNSRFNSARFKSLRKSNEFIPRGLLIGFFYFFLVYISSKFFIS
jgi:hypothetical protein